MASSAPINTPDVDDCDEVCCPICLGDFSPRLVVRTSCGHRFCEPCLEKLLRTRRSAGCPVCRATFEEYEGTPALFLAGDQIYYKGASGVKFAEHHGIYIGDNTVAHLANGESLTSSQAIPATSGLIGMDNAQVTTCTLEQFLETAKTKKSRVYVRHYRPGQCFEPATVILRAREHIGVPYEDYSVLYNNCEHWAVYIKTGRRYSQQTANAMAGVGAVLGAMAMGPVGVLLGGVGGFLMSDREVASQVKGVLTASAQAVAAQIRGGPVR